MTTIGQLAAYAGVTIKAIRHYHERGLLDEPPRDASGYRRYGARHAIELVKIRTLAEAGVPLARIKELLAADPERFATAIDEIDRNLQERIDGTNLPVGFDITFKPFVQTISTSLVYRFNWGGAPISAKY